MQEIFDKLEKEIKGMFHGENSGHDLDHLKRTVTLALHLQEKEGGDELVIAVSALLHDIHRIMQNEKGKYVTPKESLPKIKELLALIDISEDKKEKILHCIEFHEGYNFGVEANAVNDIETLIIQDADNLDAIGAIGIARTFSYGSSSPRPFWIPEVPFDSKEYDPAIDQVSTIHHFYMKLLKLKDNMNTEKAKEMAIARHKFMELFLEEFFKEWKGEK